MTLGSIGYSLSFWYGRWPGAGSAGLGYAGPVGGVDVGVGGEFSALVSTPQQLPESGTLASAGVRAVLLAGVRRK